MAGRDLLNLCAPGRCLISKSDLLKLIPIFKYHHKKLQCLNSNKSTAKKKKKKYNVWKNAVILSLHFTESYPDGGPTKMDKPMIRSPGSQIVHGPVEKGMRRNGSTVM